MPRILRRGGMGGGLRDIEVRDDEGNPQIVTLQPGDRGVAVLKRVLGVYGAPRNGTDRTTIPQTARMDDRNYEHLEALVNHWDNISWSQTDFGQEIGSYVWDCLTTLYSNQLRIRRREAERAALGMEPIPQEPVPMADHMDAVHERINQALDAAPVAPQRPQEVPRAVRAVRYEDYMAPNGPIRWDIAQPVMAANPQPAAPRPRNRDR